ncbi:hypothetical protein LTR87_015071 [Friedmanniomyces endolithicus]|nr:hypothetical protein LTR87_015071 [Friedmanniomyces endolithicus]
MHHWMHAPTTLSTASLLGSGGTVTRWDYLVIHLAKSTDSLTLPSGLDEHVREKWSIVSEVSDDILAGYADAHIKRLSNAVPTLPTGWSASDYSCLDASMPPPDVEASLALQAYPFNSNKDSDSPVVLKDWIRALGTRHTGPVQMLNLDCCNPGRRPDFDAYIMAFSASIGSKYGGEGTVMSFGHDVTEWPSRKEEGEMTVAEAKESGEGYGMEGGTVVGWEDVKLLDDPESAEADRKYKVGVLRNGPIVCCTEVEIE